MVHILLILWHVHPSGIEAEPSDADKETTEAFDEAFDTVGVILMDHLIIGGDVRKRSYFSFLEDGAVACRLTRAAIVDALNAGEFARTNFPRSQAS